MTSLLPAFRWVALAAAVVFLLTGVQLLWGAQEAWLQPGTKTGQTIVGPHGAPMVWVPKGSFVMGRVITDDGYSVPGERDEMLTHEINITSGFWMDKFEVTTDVFAKFLKDYGNWVD